MLLRQAILGLLVVFIYSPVGSSSAKAADLPSYLAVYDLTLDRATPRSSLVGATGSMAIEWRDVCDGWSSSQRVTIALSEIWGNIIESDSNFASWESRDGLAYRFDVRNFRDGNLHEQFRGHATLSGPGGKGKVVYLIPEGKSLDLPKETIFPSGHLFLLVDAANKGKKTLYRLVFDGANKEGMFDINAVIGDLTPAEAPDDSFDFSLNEKYWPVRLAFFSTKADVDLPDYETTVHLSENGVAREILLDYGNFKIKGILNKLEFPPEPSC